MAIGYFHSEAEDEDDHSIHSDADLDDEDAIRDLGVRLRRARTENLLLFCAHLFDVWQWHLILIMTGITILLLFRSLTASAGARTAEDALVTCVTTYHTPLQNNVEDPGIPTGEQRPCSPNNEDNLDEGSETNQRTQPHHVTLPNSPRDLAETENDAHLTEEPNPRVLGHIPLHHPSHIEEPTAPVCEMTARLSEAGLETNLQHQVKTDMSARMQLVEVEGDGRPPVQPKGNLDRPPESVSNDSFIESTRSTNAGAMTESSPRPAPENDDRDSSMMIHLDASPN